MSDRETPTIPELLRMATVMPMDPRNRDLLIKAADEIDRLRDALEHARDQFQFYVNQHLSKTPPDEGKARVNRDYANACSAALSNSS
jgi:hypothetical protein